MQPFAPPQIPANDLRPGRHWYATAAPVSVVLIVLGVAIGAVIALVTAVRRSRHRKRLLAERHGSGGGHPAVPGPVPTA